MQPEPAREKKPLKLQVVVMWLLSSPERGCDLSLGWPTARPHCGRVRHFDKTLKGVLQSIVGRCGAPGVRWRLRGAQYT